MSYEYEDLNEGNAKPQAKFNEDGSVQLSMQYVGIEPPTAEEFIRQCNFDPKEWAVDKLGMRNWTTSMKMQDGNGDQVLAIVKNWYIKGDAYRITPIENPNFPPIKPIEINVSNIFSGKGEKCHRSKSKLKTAIVFSDPHFGFVESGDYKNPTLLPFHDREALDILLTIVEEIQPDDIISMGDTLDLPDWSDKFLRSPEVCKYTQPAIEECGWWLAKLVQACPTAKCKKIEGNHDYRMYNTIVRYNQYAYGLRPAMSNEDSYPALSVPNLLSLDKLKIEWIGDYPNGKVWINDALCVVHGDVVKGKSGMTVSKVLDDANHSYIFGHIHRHERATKTIHTKNGIVFHEAVCPGAMCHIDGRVPAHKKDVNWSQGFAVITYEENSSNFQIETIHIVDGTCFFRGKKYVGKDRREQIKKDIGYKNL